MGNRQSCPNRRNCLNRSCLNRRSAVRIDPGLRHDLRGDYIEVQTASETISAPEAPPLRALHLPMPDRPPPLPPNRAVVAVAVVVVVVVVAVVAVVVVVVVAAVVNVAVAVVVVREVPARKEYYPLGCIFAGPRHLRAAGAAGAVRRHPVPPVDDSGERPVRISVHLLRVVRAGQSFPVVVLTGQFVVSVLENV